MARRAMQTTFLHLKTSFFVFFFFEHSLHRVVNLALQLDVPYSSRYYFQFEFNHRNRPVLGD
jgi:hypothetical protein